MKLPGAQLSRKPEGSEIDVRRLAGAMLCSLLTVGLYMLLTTGIVGEAIRWAILAMATLSSVLAINGLGWGALPDRPAQGSGRPQIAEVPPPLDVVAIWPPMESSFGMPVSPPSAEVSSPETTETRTAK